MLSKQKILKMLSEEKPNGLNALSRGVELKKKEYIWSHIGGRYIITNYYEAYYYKKYLDILEKGNDATRGGRDGDYVIFRNNKKNRETIEFIKNVINLL